MGVSDKEPSKNPCNKRIVALPPPLGVHPIASSHEIITELH